jgi:hypothetical protein
MKFPFHLNFHWKGLKSSNSSNRRNPPSKEIPRKMTLPSRTPPTETFLELPRRLANSTEGRFTIIDEKSKDSESFDDASSTDSDDNNKFSRSFVTTRTSTLLSCPSPTPIPLTVPRPANSHHLPLPQIRTMTNNNNNNLSTGRFRVGKVIGDPGAASNILQLPLTTSEKRYKRGRWECKEWYDQNDLVADSSKRQAKAPLALWNDISFPVPTVTFPSNNNNNNSAQMPATTNLLSQNDQNSSTTSLHSHPPLFHESTIFSMEEQSDESDRENNLPQFSSVTPIMDIQNSNSSVEKPNSLPLPPVLNTPTSRSKLFATSPEILSGRATPLEMSLHYGLERSLSGNGGGNIFTYPLFDPSMPSSLSNGNRYRCSSVSSQD